MSEILHAMADQQTSPPEEEIYDGVHKIDAFLRSEAPILGQLLGVHGLTMRAGEGWATNLETGEVTIDPRFFLEQGYTPDMATYAGLHEVSAHLREVLTEPALTRQVKNFVSPEKIDGKITQTAAQEAQARGIFHNILSDVAGNNLTHAVLPRMASVAEQLYRDKLFTDADYSDVPRHLQFLYKFIRDEMIPGSETAVTPEVDALLAQFRDYHGMGQDLLKYSTQVAKSPTVAMPAQEKFDLWTKVIYPRWRELYEQDAADPQFQQQPQEGENAQNDDSQSDDQQAQPGEQGAQPDFSQYYQEYHDNHHPDPMNDEEHEQIEQAGKKIADEDRQKEQAARREKREQAQKADPSYQRDAQVRRETGHSLAELQAYNREIERWRDQIDEVRGLFRSLLDEHVGLRRKLRGGHTEGAILTPDRLAQTVVDIRSGINEPKAFSNYEKHVSERELTGRTDYVFIFDRSGSMRGEKSHAAASSAVICLEALAGVQRDIEEFREATGIDAEVDIRTAVYTFNDTIDEAKPLSHGLDMKQRLDTYGLILSPDLGNADTHALQKVLDLPPETDRKRILVVVSDGEADDKALARTRVEELRHSGWQVYGVSIGSEAAVELYSPHSRRIDDPSLLPETMKQFIEETL